MTTVTRTAYPRERDIAFWLPRLEAADLLTPTTVLVSPPQGGVPVGGQQSRAYWEFLATILAAGKHVGFPFVLRTGLACAKHRWRRAAFVAAPSEIDSHLRATQAWCDETGIPVETWAVRQFVPSVVSFTAYDGLPIGREFRTFVRDGLPVCIHPVWPYAAVTAGRPPEAYWPDAFAALTELNPTTDRKILLTLARRAASYLSGAWSIDWLAVADGRWVAHSASPADLSWHSPDCPHHPAAPGAATAPPLPESAYFIDPEVKGDLPLLCQLNHSLEDELTANGTGDGA